VDSEAVLALVSHHGYRRSFVDPVSISIEINGAVFEREVEPRMLLSDFIRHEAHLTGTHVGCEHGVCGACTVQLEGAPVRACLLLAIQAHGRRVRTVEGLAAEDGTLHPLQQAFHETHALQCGFCTPGFLMALEPMLDRAGELDDARLRELIGGNLCRCTGYDSIVSAVRLAHERMAQAGELDPPVPPAADPDQARQPTPPGPAWRRPVPAAVGLLALVAGAAAGLRRR
jgi:aerobic-type carbon monoxide dehydrogenase small subunit (CoxS/CutS family)